ncbi:L-aminopeptidase/D-esterase [Mycobacterium basiliense]|uniref:L-aminopeptidase/D-esterase n=1 Tax=Mycobacterium basiliense TaxID=2094119 RepID=A0A3S4DV59_9MYCO|nr:P1 family peptidase [Mycobacterium basiliense]VDM89942.1 L-aminopeptidase/D-esterase [Mycobacterium basiliense]
MSSITDVGGIRVGHYQRLDADASVGAGWACGVTVVLTPPGTAGAVDCRGGAPGTRETDLLAPVNSVRFVDAVLLAGGSAYGLAAADGVMRWLEEHDRGVAMSGGVVPIVPGAVIFDLPVGGWDCRPTADFGYSACAAAGGGVGVHEPLAVGTIGAGVGARAGVLKGGVGTASITLPSGVTVGAVVVVNSAGEVVDPSTGLPWMADLIGEFRLTAPPAEQIAALAQLPSPLSALGSPLNTTIGVVATDAALSPAACQRVAIAAHDGLARTIRPAHTPLDGDTIFALATGALDMPPEPGVPAALSPETGLVTAVGVAAADCVARAVVGGVIAAKSLTGILSYRDMLPGAFGESRSSSKSRRGER